MIPDLSQPQTLDLDGEAQLEAVRKILLPFMEKKGDGAYCKVELWRNHPAVKEALKDGDFLVLAWPDGSISFAYAMSEALLSAIPRPETQQGAQYFKHQRALAKRGEFKDGNQA